MKLISVITPCYNEEDNVREVYRQVKAVFAGLGNYRYEHLFIDNASTDRTVHILRETGRRGPERQGHRQQPQLRPDPLAVPRLPAGARRRRHRPRRRPPGPARADPEFVQKWEEGVQVRHGRQGSEPRVAAHVRRPVRLLPAGRPALGNRADAQFTGFGLYDRVVIEALRSTKDPIPVRSRPDHRGRVQDRAEIALPPAVRKRGITKNNFFTLYDVAMLGITRPPEVPLRLATMAGFACPSSAC